MVNDVEYYEDMPDYGTPLGNGWFAVDLGDDLYEIFDENGTPLGFVRFDGDIEEWEDFDDIVPLANFLWPEDLEEATMPTEPATEAPADKTTPKTGDGLYVIFALLGLTMLGISAGMRILRKKQVL